MYALHLYGGVGEVFETVDDVTGRRIARLVDGTRLGGGAHTVSWNGRDALGRPAPAGVYLVRLEATGEVRTRKVVRLR